MDSTLILAFYLIPGEEELQVDMFRLLVRYWVSDQSNSRLTVTVQLQLLPAVYF